MESPSNSNVGDDPKNLRLGWVIYEEIGEAYISPYILDKHCNILKNIAKEWLERGFELRPGYYPLHFHSTQNDSLYDALHS
jgi:hypothetical protein